MEIYSGKLKAKEFKTNPPFGHAMENFFFSSLKKRPMIRSNALAETIESDMLVSSWPMIRYCNPR